MSGKNLTLRRSRTEEGCESLVSQLQSIRMVFRIVERIVNAGRVVSEMKSSRGIRVLLNRD